MGTVNSSKRQTTGLLSKGHYTPCRTITFDVDFENDFTFDAADGVANLGTLPAGTIVLGATIKQISPDTTNTTGTVVVRVGTTALTGTLANNAAAGTNLTTLATNVPLAVTTASDINLISATDAREFGKAQVSVLVAEGFAPTFPVSVDRDVLA